MPNGTDNPGFVARFERAMEGNDSRIRAVETGQASLKQELKSLKEDRCAKHEFALQELYDSRNKLEKTVEQLKGSATGLAKLCENLDVTVSVLDKRALLLGKGEESVIGKLETISNWDVPGRLQQLETDVKTIKEEKTEKKQETKDYRLLLYGAILGGGFSAVSGFVVWYLTT